MEESDYDALRDRMVREQLIARGIRNPRVLIAMQVVPRHLFVPAASRASAYDDSPLPIGDNQTISQPYIVAYMIECLGLTGKETVLEIGTGSGYQTAILCMLARHVVSIERHETLALQAGETLDRLGYDKVEILVGDGSQGLPDMSPYDAIVVSAVAPSIPRPLLTQLIEGGRLVIPVAHGLPGRDQVLERVTRTGNHWPSESLLPVVFVPLIGRHGYSSEVSGPPKEV